MLAIETLKQVGKGSDQEIYEEPEGEYTDFLSQNTNTVTVLTNLEREKGGEGDTDDEEDDGEEAISPVDPSSQTVKELKTSLDEEYTSPGEYAALLEAEKQGKDRATAKRAIKDHME